MSVYIDNCQGNFNIKKENIPGAFEAAKKLVQSGEYAVHWDDKWHTSLENSKDFIEFLETTSWEVDESDGNITAVRAGENYDSDDFILFKAIAPFVEANSYIDIETSDFQKFEWFFDGYTCIRKEGTVDYDSNIEIVEALLKNRKELPTLLGVHPELDKRIHEILKVVHP